MTRTVPAFTASPVAESLRPLGPVPRLGIDHWNEWAVWIHPCLDLSRSIQRPSWKDSGGQSCGVREWSVLTRAG